MDKFFNPKAENGIGILFNNIPPFQMTLVILYHESNQWQVGCLDRKKQDSFMDAAWDFMGRFRNLSALLFI